MHRRNQRVERIGNIIIGIAISMLLVWGFHTWQEATRWDPLGEYPLQIITTTHTATIDDLDVDDSDVGLPVIYLNQEVSSNGVKCVKPEEGVVQVKGQLSWVSDRPPGKIIDISGGAGTRGPGCVNYSFENDIPDKVLKEIERFSSEGLQHSTWHITGTEVPIKADGTEGVPRTWITTSFVVLHREAVNE